MTPKLPDAVATCWDGDPEVVRTGDGGYRAELWLVAFKDRPKRVMTIGPEQVAMLRDLVDGDPVELELARAILDAAGTGDGQA